jgi:hypothetical protein
MSSTSQSPQSLSELASRPIRIGVLAHKSMDICREMWQPTMAYLDKALPGCHPGDQMGKTPDWYIPPDKMKPFLYGQQSLKSSE